MKIQISDIIEDINLSIGMKECLVAQLELLDTNNKKKQELDSKLKKLLIVPSLDNSSEVVSKSEFRIVWLGIFKGQDVVIKSNWCLYILFDN